MQQHTLSNSSGLSITILNYGGIIQSVKTPSGTDLVLGFAKAEDYVKHNVGHFGAIIGRVANRVANAEFTIDGHHYQLERNEKNKQCLHSGSTGLQFAYWELAFLAEDNAMQLKYNSPNGEGGFPGNVEFIVTYQLTDTNQLIIDYTATTDMLTPIDLTNHTYWNLSGGGTILHNQAKFFAHHYLPVDTDNIPLGTTLSTNNSALDFSQAKTIGQDIAQLDKTRGYDQYYILDNHTKHVQLAAEFNDLESGCHLKVFTDQPGFQFYTGNFLKHPYTAFCVETQNYPNAVNQANFPSPLLSPKETYQHKTIFQLILE